MSIPENFANHPRSVAEIRSERAHDGSLWSPRDALIDVLRRIDSGEVKCDALVVCFRETTGPNNVKSHFAISSPDMHVGLGLLAYGTHAILMS